MALFLARRRHGNGEFRGHLAVAVLERARLAGRPPESEDSPRKALKEVQALERPEVEDGIPVSTVCRLLLPPIALVGSGVGVLMVLEDWPLATCLYVVSQMVTTVGWGDITVTSLPAKVFLSFYAIAILTVLAYYDNLLTVFPYRSCGSQLRADMLRDVSHKSPCGIFGAIAKQLCSIFVALLPVMTFIGIGSVYFFFREGCVCKKSVDFQNARSSCIDTEGFEKCVETGGITQSLVDIVYMSVISLCTIGFGDFHPYPGDTIGLIFTLLWTVLGVAATAVSIANLSMAFLGMDLAKQLETRDVEFCTDEEALMKIDKESSGRLSRGEYLSWMVLKCDLVSKDLVDEINASYDALNAAKTKEETGDFISAKRVPNNNIPDRRKELQCEWCKEWKRADGYTLSQHHRFQKHGSICRDCLRCG
eukprot:TRINITY_DN964_c0_g2_i1.p1 TRINITY_DN964_c0_g2~~TRINITY_DN964_c0_g2_i1.p1  ORF type:complete len:421 (+),score=47.64 TRINITY_DN964_c0_g2_i1:73-1335(+)